MIDIQNVAMKKRNNVREDTSYISPIRQFLKVYIQLSNRGTLVLFQYFKIIFNQKKDKNQTILTNQVKIYI